MKNLGQKFNNFTESKIKNDGGVLKGHRDQHEEALKSQI